MTSMSTPSPIRFGLIGTGYAAKLRAETLNTEPRSQLVAVAGHRPETTQEFSQIHRAIALDRWQDLVQRSDLDGVIICTINRDHGAICRAALEAGKHVVVEYPLALDANEAVALIGLARSRQRLLHVEHIELLGGVHQALKAALPQVGEVFAARYATLSPQHPAPPKWTYQPDLFGFPLVGALSRLHRLIDLLGPVEQVFCQARFWPPQASQYTSCLCQAQLTFQNGVQADVVYGKGERIWRSERSCLIQGSDGALVFEGDRGLLITPAGEAELPVGGRRGLFAKDTVMVLDYLTTGTPLYVTPEASLYTLRVADAARRSAATGQPIHLRDRTPPTMM